jgi:hypothetical protein
MTVYDYVIDIVLVGIIFWQVRTHPLTFRSPVLPLALLVVAGIVYLRPVRLEGNDLNLILILSGTGIILGALSGLGDKIWHDTSDKLMARATLVSVVVWVVGMGFRFAFAFYASHSGAASIARFSIQHEITGAAVWTTALVLMAFGQVLARIAILQARRIRTEHRQVMVPAE